MNINTMPNQLLDWFVQLYTIPDDCQQQSSGEAFDDQLGTTYLQYWSKPQARIVSKSSCPMYAQMTDAQQQAIHNFTPTPLVEDPFFVWLSQPPIDPATLTPSTVDLKSEWQQQADANLD
jgi:hypothetical protein